MVRFCHHTFISPQIESKSDLTMRDMNVRFCLGAPGRKADIQIRVAKPPFEARDCRMYQGKSKINKVVSGLAGATPICQLVISPKNNGSHN